MKRLEHLKHDEYEIDYDYIKYFKKAYEHAEAHQKDFYFINYTYVKNLRDYYMGSIRQIKHLIQFDSRPNHDLIEPKWEIYKVTLTFQCGGLEFTEII